MRWFCRGGEGLSLLNSASRIPPKPGVYTLVIVVDNPVSIRVGSLGLLPFPKGVYAYTGSALGKSVNLRNRLMRHLGSRARLKWHIDYLLEAEDVRVEAVVFATTNRRAECAVSKLILERLGREPVFRGFGSSDCKEGCPTHLCFCGQVDWLETASWIAHLYVEVGLFPTLIASALPEECGLAYQATEAGESGS